MQPFLSGEATLAILLSLLTFTTLFAAGFDAPDDDYVHQTMQPSSKPSPCQPVVSKASEDASSVPSSTPTEKLTSKKPVRRQVDLASRLRRHLELPLPLMRTSQLQSGIPDPHDKGRASPIFQVVIGWSGPQIAQAWRVPVWCRQYLEKSLGRVRKKGWRHLEGGDVARVGVTEIPMMDCRVQ